MSQYYLFGTLLLSFILLIGCSSEALPVESQDHNEKLNEFSIVKDSLPGKESIEKEAEEEKVTGINNDSLSTSQNDDSILLEEMELLKEKLRKYIFDDYMGSSDYVYAKGINWSLNFYDNLSAEEIWDVIEEYKDINNEEGTLFEQAQYLSINAPLKIIGKSYF
ncbi:hypothetical protein [Halalkalibacter akibai]|uniref:Uncharacterized protein n=1 Tax=Halalkalibacter akibai (strain ATCC 43226 / DSM 21942 / CIP 109018 / JCM 9157 / 1139) TaxID=1236973 RepID=W4QZL6_HALA3|nr:hypothetical protein [Halalkalibacter akibai]GAE37511.1 hypothetical protein JCM9157_4817 [Halalkalibacter akibai JCM 9157]